MVSIAPLDRPLTADDLAELPDDGMTYELIWGELSVTPAPIPKHQRVSRDLVMKIHDFIWDSGLGEVLYAPVVCISTSTRLFSQISSHLMRRIEAS